MTFLTPRSLTATLGSALLLYLAWSGLVEWPGLQDNDWPLLMWLATRATWTDWSPLAIGHYGFLQLVLVRGLWPLFGGTLVAAKVLNLVSISAIVTFLSRLAPRLAAGQGWSGPTAVLLVACAGETLLTGQSEFADPLALALWLGALHAVWAPPSGARWGLAGVLLGLAAGCRTHFFFFGIVTLAVLAAVGKLEKDTTRSHVGRLILGFVIGYAPAAAIYLRVHGTLTSPVAPTFIGQAVLGYDELDLFSTYAAHPFGDVMRHHLRAVVELALHRLVDFPTWFWIPLATTVLAAARASRHGEWRLPGLLLLALVYYVGFVTVSWQVTPRLLLPFATMLALGTAAGLHAMLSTPRAILLGSVLAVASLVQGLPCVGEGLKDVDQMWTRSQELTRALRARGLRTPREAFVADWNRFLVDDPELVTFYNFGYWNLLVPSFRSERPNPLPAVEDPEAFATFLREQEVRFAVLPRSHPRLRVLAALARGELTSKGLQKLEMLPEDTLFEVSR